MNQQITALFRSISYKNGCTKHRHKLIRSIAASNQHHSLQCHPFFFGGGGSGSGFYSTTIHLMNNTYNNNSKNGVDFSKQYTTTAVSKSSSSSSSSSIRLSKLISQKGLNMQMSRKSAESIITDGQVTVAGQVVTNPNFKINLPSLSQSNDTCRNDSIGDSSDKLYDSIKVAGRHFILDKGQTTVYNTRSSNSNINNSNDESVNQKNVKASIIKETTKKTRVWLAHKLKGELVAEHDPLGRPSLIERLYRGGVGKSKKSSAATTHLKPVGRLDMMTEGLILITNDGSYVREMTLPSNQIQRTYRVRVHGRITQQKLNAIRNGISIDGVHYRGMKVNLELNKSSSKVKGGNTNSWLRVTCTEGKNRMIRKVLDNLGLQVTRLIRISFGDYDLNTIPPGLAIEVPVKPLQGQKRRGLLFPGKYSKQRENQSAKKLGYNIDEAPPSAAPITWVRHS